MKKQTGRWKRAAVLAGALMAAPLGLRAAAPVINSLSVDAAVAGNQAVFHVTVSDADSNLDHLAIFEAPKGTTSWTQIGTVTLTGSQATVNFGWTALMAGAYVGRVQAYDSTGGLAQSDAIFDVFAGDEIISALTLGSGDSRIFVEDGEIETTENDSSPSVVVQSGGQLIFWARYRVVLKPGFRAESGSSLWATVDENMNGYSDMEEATDTDGDGMFDAWEVDHGLNMNDPSDANQDADGDGVSNLQEFKDGTDPQNPNDNGLMPSGYNLVLATPSSTYYGVKTATWEIDSVGTP